MTPYYFKHKVKYDVETYDKSYFHKGRCYCTRVSVANNAIYSRVSVANNAIYTRVSVANNAIYTRVSVANNAIYTRVS